MNPQEAHKKDHRKAILGTIVLHLALALLFIFYGLKEPHPPRKEEMVSIAMDLGTDLKGQGQQESQGQKEQKSNNEQQESSQKQEQEKTSSNEVATQEEAPVEASEKQEGEEDAQEQEETKEEEQQEVSEELQEAQNRFEDMEDGGGGEGDDGVSGNEGNPEGRPKGKGSLPGAGGSWKLSGRKILEKPQPKKPQEEGKVVVDIWVDQDGNVIRTSPNLSRSNTTSDRLLKLAQDAAQKAKFNPSPNAAVEQKGTFTFVFELR